MVLILVSAGISFGQNGQYYQGPYDPIKIHFKKPGFISINEFVYADGLGEVSGNKYSDYFYGFTTIFGYSVNQNFSFGAGLGAFFYNGGYLIPFFADMRYTFNYKKINPYFFADAGFITDPSDPVSTTKFYINPGVGIRYIVSYKIAATASFGGFVQEGGSESGDRDTFLTYKIGIIIKPKRGFEY